MSKTRRFQLKEMADRFQHIVNELHEMSNELWELDMTATASSCLAMAVELKKTQRHVEHLSASKED